MKITDIRPGKYEIDWYLDNKYVDRGECDLWEKSELVSRFRNKTVKQTITGYEIKVGKYTATLTEREWYGKTSR